MTEPLHRISELIIKFHQSSLEPSEREELDSWMSVSPERRALYGQLTDDEAVKSQLKQIAAYSEERVRQKITQRVPGAFSSGPGPVHGPGPAPARVHSPGPNPFHTPGSDATVRLWNRPLVRWTAAAAILLFVSAGIYLGISRTKNIPAIAKTNPQPTENDILPGGNNAVLTLAGGQRIILDSAHAGNLVIQGNSQVSKTGNGKLAYQSTGNPSRAEILYNNLTTPRGGQYQIRLPDGTKVWLNASSSITYPTAFTGTKRRVTITGEAYLEVAKDAAHPFYVGVPAPERGGEHGSPMDIAVLGTSFNINAYNDEDLARATLLEGSIQVGVNGVRKIIRPGEQTIIDVAGGVAGARTMTVNAHADTEQAIAWKNGLFAFTNANLPAVMRQLARWYNVDVVYEGIQPRREFNGEIGKNLTLDQVLKVLTQSRIHYTIAGKILTIRAS